VSGAGDTGGREGEAVWKSRERDKGEDKVSKREVFIVVWAKDPRDMDEYTETIGLRLVENEHVEGGVLTAYFGPPSFFLSEEEAQAAIDRTKCAEKLEVAFCEGRDLEPDCEWDNPEEIFNMTDLFQIWNCEEAGL
jgi:hypothetical protein